jgi:L-iditol 2-dehydrogenase
MRALWLVGPERVELRELPAPAPGPGELVLAIEAATTCGTDLKVWRRGGHPRMLTVPGPFGHEMTGVVAALGRGASRFAVGDALVVANSASCGACDACLAGSENLCRDLVYLNGAFADRLLVPARFVERSCHRRPAALPARVASIAEPLACVEHGIERLHRHRLDSPRRVLVLGGGSLGLLFASALAEEGHETTLGDPHADRRALALELGAARTLDLESSHPTAIERRFDVAVDATGTVAGWESAVGALAPGGTALLFGGCAPDTLLPLPTYPVHYDELALLGCYHHTPRSFARAVERLERDPARHARLLSGDCGLGGVGEALRAMRERRAIKVSVVPEV